MYFKMKKLNEKISKIKDYSLSVISASVGSGKTTILVDKLHENDICQCSTSNLENKIVSELENVLRVHSYGMHSEDWYCLNLLKIKCDKLFQRNIDVFF